VEALLAFAAALLTLRLAGMLLGRWRSRGEPPIAAWAAGLAAFADRAAAFGVTDPGGRGREPNVTLERLWAGWRATYIDTIAARAPSGDCPQIRSSSGSRPRSFAMIPQGRRLGL